MGDQSRVRGGSGTISTLLIVVTNKDKSPLLERKQIIVFDDNKFKVLSFRNARKRDFLGRSNCPWHLEAKDYVSHFWICLHWEMNSGYSCPRGNSWVGPAFVSAVAVLKTSCGQTPLCYVNWCIVDLSPRIISLLSWRGELGEGRHWRTINTQAPSLQGRLWQQNRGPSPHPLLGQLTCNQSSAVRRVVLCEGRDGMGLTRSCNWVLPQLEVTIKLWA